MKRFLTVLFLPWSLWAGLGVWPDYLDVTMPPNIAPLNFKVSGRLPVRAELRAADGAALAARGDADGVIAWDPGDWHRFLAGHAGEDLVVMVANADEVRVATNRVSRHLIDPYLAYRLILPGYSSFTEHGVYERDLTSFRERPLYRNVQSSPRQCVNCHTYNQGDPQQYFFHTRIVEPGTQIVSRKWGRRKVNLKVRGQFGAGSYGEWHPSGDYIAFSVNETMQCFYFADTDRIEVMDLRSDLVLYSLADNTVIPVESGESEFECYPAWSPDGRRLYSVRARTPFTTRQDDVHARCRRLENYFKDLRYDLVVREFDVATRRCSPPRILVDAQAEKVSITLPRASPDGRWLVVAAGAYGSCHLTHRNSELWILDLKANTRRVASELSASGGTSYHTFSHDGTWMVFSSRREDRTYTRPFFTAFDKTAGRFSKPFLLPVRRPREHLERMDSYNIPEFATGPIEESAFELRQLVEGVPTPARSRM